MSLQFRKVLANASKKKLILYAYGGKNWGGQRVSSDKSNHMLIEMYPRSLVPRSPHLFSKTLAIKKKKIEV
jgi:hypothetical protein